MRTVLTEAHEDQIRNMRADGKTYQEIRQFFQNTYKIKIYDSYIAKIQRGDGKFGAKAASKSIDGKKQPGKAKRKYTRKNIKKEPTEEKITTSEEFASHIHAAWNIHKKDFLVRVGEALTTI